jgi:hypothetical protein
VGFVSQRADAGRKGTEGETICGKKKKDEEWCEKKKDWKVLWNDKK